MELLLARNPCATVADELAEWQIRYPDVSIVHCDTRKLAQERTYRSLAAAHAWARDEPAVGARLGRIGSGEPQLSSPGCPLSRRRMPSCAPGRARTGWPPQIVDA